MLKFKCKDKNGEGKHEELRMLFVVELLRRHLFAVFERSPVDKSTWYIKIYAPFSTLAHEAERLHIEFQTEDRRITYIKHLVHERKIKEEKRKEERAQSDGRQVSEQWNEDEADVDISFENLRSSAVQRRLTFTRSASSLPGLPNSFSVASIHPDEGKEGYVEGTDGIFHLNFQGH